MKREYLLLFFLVLVLSIGFALSSVFHRGVPVDFAEYDVFNTSVRCVFYGARALSCWEVEQ